MEISIIVIGDELLLGDVTDTNSGDIARAFAPAGWAVRYVLSVHDDAHAITDAIKRAMKVTKVVLTTGGLGPTKDDITKGVLCDIFGGGLHFDAEVMKNVERIFSERHLEMNHLTRTQAMVPDSCKVIPNELGTAPIMWFEKDGRVLVAMPGVPFETKRALTHVVPALLEHFGEHPVIRHRHFTVTGICESSLAQVLESWEDSLPEGMHLAYLPNPGYIRLRLDAVGCDEEAVEQELDARVDALLPMLGENLIYQGDFSPERMLMKRLGERGFTMATAESCTGGNVAHRMTMLPGVSEVFRGGVVAYDNDVKHRVLGVEEDVLASLGAVSEPVVKQMAEGACRVLGADVAVATSGIAGPGGATPGKPVGTVCIAVATPDGTVTDTLHLPGDRGRVIDRATTTVILRLLSALS
jgi:cinA-like protein